MQTAAILSGSLHGMSDIPILVASAEWTSSQHMGHCMQASGRTEIISDAQATVLLFSLNL